ncbi:ribonuclease catalytic domain-containing protein [Chloroflexota bacterium]
MTFLIHSLVAYKNRPALIIENSPDLQIELKDGRTQKVRSKDIILIHPGPVLNIAHLEAQSGDAETAWEILSHDAVTLRGLTELAFGRFTPSTAWGAWQLICDSLYFQGTPDCITACSREEVSRKQETRRLKTSQKIARIEFLNRVANRQVTSEDDHFLAEVEAMALGEANESRVLRDLGRSQNPQNAHSLLLDLGRWNNRFNPYPKRFGVPLSTPVINLPELPSEDRVDLTHLPAFAIDNAWTTDTDDALSLEGPSRLWVHVADIAALVLPDSPADLEARNRAASLYLPEMTVPMLPAEASERLALGVRDVSPALSFGLNLDSEGGVIGMEIVPSWVRISRLSYEQVESMFHDLPFEGLLSLAQNNEARRKLNGAVSIELPEVDIRVEDGKVIFHPVRFLRSQMIVREAMLMAGEAVAGYALKEGIPFAFSTQEATQIPALPDGLAGMYALRRLMKRGQLKNLPARHVGMGLDMYTQVTSPLRRYQDLIVHQQLRAHIRGHNLLTAQEMLQRLGAAEAVISNMRQVERLSNQHWTVVYLSETPQWHGEGVIVETDGPHSTALIPNIGLEIHLNCRRSLPLNTRVPIVLGASNVPELSAFFRIDD